MTGWLRRGAEENNLDLREKKQEAGKKIA
jgi:hypothetical protein